MSDDAGAPHGRAKKHPPTRAEIQAGLADVEAQMRARSDTRDCSPLSRTSLTNSRRRSSVISGRVTRTISPSLPTLAPRFGAATMAFSISLSADLS